MKLVFYISIILLFSNQLAGQQSTGYLTADGSWCWFSDPRAILVDNYIFTGWVKSDGSIEAV